MVKVIEVAKFQVHPQRVEALTREHGGALAAVQRAFPGLRSVRLIHLGGDVWADVAEWTDEATARAAAREAGSIPEFAHWCRNIERDLSLDHGLVHSTVAPGSR